MTRYLIEPTPAEDLPPPPPTAEDLNIPAEAFGARTAFGALEPGEQLDPGHWDEINRANTTRAAELQNQFLDKQREILHTGPDAYLSKTGRDAVLAAPNGLSQLEAARQEAIGQAANEAQRKLLTSALGEHRITEHYRVGTHAGEQSLEWQKQTATERLNQLRQQAALDYTDPGSIEAYSRASESAGRERARTLKLGPDSDEAQAEVDAARSSIWRSAIESALDNAHPKPAINLFQLAADRLSSQDSVVLAPQIEAAKEHEIGQAYLTNVPIPDSRDLAELDAAHQVATAQNEADWPDHDSQRATNQYFIDSTFAEKRHGLAYAKADLDQSVKNWLSQPGQILRPPPDVWSRLTAEERQAVDNQLAQNAFDPATTTDGDAGRSGSSPTVVPPPESPEYEVAKEEGRHVDTEEQDPRQPEQDRAITDAIVRRAAIDAQNGKSDDVATDPKVRAEIERGLTSNDQQERLKWARAPLHSYKSSLSDADFARLAALQRQISPFDGNPREGLGHPIGTLDEHAQLALALLARRRSLPIKNAQMKHIFRKDEGHLPDTTANRRLLEEIANDPRSAFSTDKHGNTWSSRTLPDRTQAWVQTRKGTIINGGVNSTPREANPETGLSAPRKSR